MLLHGAKRRVSSSYIRVLRDMYSRLKVCLVFHSLYKADDPPTYHSASKQTPNPDIFGDVEKDSRQYAYFSLHSSTIVFSMHSLLLPRLSFLLVSICLSYNNKRENNEDFFRHYFCLSSVMRTTF